MAISVTGPDGSTFDFPDGTDHGTITSAMQRHYGAPKDASLGVAADRPAVPSGSEPPEVRNIREGFRAQGPVKIAMGNMMGLTDEINSAGAAGIDRLVGRTDDWNERRKLYRQAFKSERADAEKRLGWGGTLAADLVGGAAASPFKAAGAVSDKLAPMVPAIPFPMVGALKPALPAPTTVTQAIVNPVLETARNLPTLMKTGAAYGGVGGFIGSQEDDLGTRGKNAAYTAMGGAVFMPGVHLGLTSVGALGPGVAGTARDVFERVTGTTPAQRAQMAATRQEMLDAGVKANEIYGPFLRPDGGTWLSRSIGNSPAGHNVMAKAADRNLGALERELGNAIDTTGAPRNRFAAGQERQQFLDRQVNQYSMPPARIQYAGDDEIARWAEPLTGHLRGSQRPQGSAGSGQGGMGPSSPSPGGGGGGAPRPGGAGPAARAPDIAQAYADARRLRYEGKLPSPDAYWTQEEAAALKDMWRYTQEKIQHPETLTNWIIKNGGIKDTGGDIAHMIGKANMRPGLINNKTGMDADSMARHAWESGFIDSVERPTINDLFAHLGDDLSGQAVVRISERTILDDLLAQNQFKDELGRHGLTARRESEFDRALKQPIPKDMRPRREPSHVEQPPVEPKAETAPLFLSPPLPEVQGRGTIYHELGPRAEDAPTFLRRRMQAVAQPNGRDVRAPRADVGRPGRAMDGEALPPEPPAGNPPQRWVPPEEAPPPEPVLTYKDRVAAMYEQQNRLIPGQARGGMGNFRDSHANDANIVRIINDIRRNARAEGRLPGDRPRMGFWESPAANDIRREVERHLPGDLVNSLFERVRVAPRQMMRYRTAVRDADTSNPMTRTTTQTWLPRAEEALTDDIAARLSRLEDGGEALRHWQNSNRQYAALKENMVAPLKPIIGENVRPEQAMDKLTTAMKGNDLRMIRAYADAHRWGGQQMEGAGALVSHLMEGGVANFAKQYSTFTPTAKAELFRGNARQLGQALDRYSKLAEPALAARDKMTWKGFNLHYGGLAAAWMLQDITTAVTMAAGQYTTAKFLSSPQYVNWLTRAAPRVANGGPSAWSHQLKLLATIAESDNTQRGKEVVSSLSRLLTYKPERRVP